jgi:MFS family permease
MNEKDIGPESVNDVEYDDNSRQAYTRGGTPEDKKLVWKQDLRILPISGGIYLLCYLDRSNIGNAKVLNASTHNDLLSETHMTAYQYTIALMVFLIAYMVFEVPSNYFLKRLSPSRWIAFLMLSWSVMTMGLGGVHNFAGVTALRFMLGVFEAGLFPGLVYYLSKWLRDGLRNTNANKRYQRSGIVQTSVVSESRFFLPRPPYKARSVVRSLTAWDT